MDIETMSPQCCSAQSGLTWRASPQAQAWSPEGLTLSRPPANQLSGVSCEWAAGTPSLGSR